MIKTIHIIIFALICNSLHATENNKCIVELAGHKYLSQSIQLLSSETAILKISNIKHANLDIHIPYSVQHLTLCAQDIKHLKLNIYAWHNPCIQKQYLNVKCANESEIMLPPRKYSYHVILATFGLTALYYLFTRE
jgi:hypothetical protein